MENIFILITSHKSYIIRPLSKGSNEGSRKVEELTCKGPSRQLAWWTTATLHQPIAWAFNTN